MPNAFRYGVLIMNLLERSFVAVAAAFGAVVATPNEAGAQASTTGARANTARPPEACNTVYPNPNCPTPPKKPECPETPGNPTGACPPTNPPKPPTPPTTPPGTGGTGTGTGTATSTSNTTVTANPTATGGNANNSTTVTANPTANGGSAEQSQQQQQQQTNAQTTTIGPQTQTTTTTVGPNTATNTSTNTNKTGEQSTNIDNSDRSVNNSKFQVGAIAGAPQVAPLILPSMCSQGWSGSIGGGNPFLFSLGAGLQRIKTAGVAFRNGMTLAEVLATDPASPERAAALKDMSNGERAVFTCLSIVDEQQQAQREFELEAQKGQNEHALALAKLNASTQERMARFNVSAQILLLQLTKCNNGDRVALLSNDGKTMMINCSEAVGQSFVRAFADIYGDSSVTMGTVVVPAPGVSVFSPDTAKSVPAPTPRRTTVRRSRPAAAKPAAAAPCDCHTTPAAGTTKPPANDDAAGSYEFDTQTLEM